jgi:hypothetical protein
MGLRPTDNDEKKKGGTFRTVLSLAAEWTL